MSGLAGYPQGRNFSFTNIRVVCTTLADVSQIAPEKPLDGLVLQHLTGTCTKGIHLQNITHAVLGDLHVTGNSGAFLTQTNVSGEGLATYQ